MRFGKTTTAVAVLSAMAAMSAVAQENMLHGLGWIAESNPGSVAKGSDFVVNSNRSMADVQAEGLGASAGFGAGALLRLISTAQVHVIGVDAADASAAKLIVTGNQLDGNVSTLGGAATVNSILFSGQGERKSLQSSQLSVGDAVAGGIDAKGAEFFALLGSASLQIPGRASANAILVQSSDVVNSRLSNWGNKAHAIRSFGGAALANTLTASRARLEGAQVHQLDNEARDLSATGGEVGIGYGVMAEGKLEGAALGNSVALANTKLVQGELLQKDNAADFVYGQGGGAQANSISLTDVQQAQGLQVTQVQNEARHVVAFGGSGSVLKGALASVDNSASALGNSVNLDRTALQGRNTYAQQNNKASNLNAQGGVALGNSVWALDASMANSHVVQTDNVAKQVGTNGGAAALMAGAIGAKEQASRAGANSLVVAGPDAKLGNTTVVLQGNEASAMDVQGGQAMANSVLVDQRASVDDTQLVVRQNKASDISTEGSEASVGAGLLWKMQQDAVVLANSMAAVDSTLGGARARLVEGNTASFLHAQGGSIVANSLSLEKGDGAGSRLEGGVLIKGNTVRDVRTEASTEGNQLSRSHTRARAAVNSTLLHDDAQLDAASSASLVENVASTISGLGGTALVHSLAVYRGATVQGSHVVIQDNQASQIVAQGDHHQQLGAGAHRHGIAVASSAYLEGDGRTLKDSLLDVRNNQAERLHADGALVLANALTLRGEGLLDTSSVVIRGNEAGAAYGFAQTTRGIFGLNEKTTQANVLLNSLDVQAPIYAGKIHLQGNKASGVDAKDASVTLNSVQQAKEASVVRNLDVTLAGNEVDFALATNGWNAAANSILQGGEAGGLRSVIVGNKAKVEASSGDALANSVQVRKNSGVQGGQVDIAFNESTVTGSGVAASVRTEGPGMGSAKVRIAANHSNVSQGGTSASVLNSGSAAGTQVNIIGNKGSASNGGTAHSVSNSGSLGGQISILGNHGNASGGTLSSVVSSSRLGGNINIMGNHGQAGAGSNANSVVNEGVANARIALIGNHGTANSASMANSVRNSGTLVGSVTLVANQATSNTGSIANSVANKGMMNANVTIAANRATVNSGGMANSVDNTGMLSGRVTVVGNQATASTGGTANSLLNKGTMNGNVTIAGNSATVSSGGVANSVVNSGVMTGRITLAANQGTANMGGTANSVVNKGVMIADVTVAGNRGDASMGGVSNSVVNNGVMAGKVLIAGNQSKAVGGISNSVINNGVVAGTVSIVGSRSAAAPGMVSGSVINTGALVGAAAVAANRPAVANPGYTYALPSTGVINQSVVIAPAVNLTFN